MLLDWVCVISNFHIYELVFMLWPMDLNIVPTDKLGWKRTLSL